MSTEYLDDEYGDSLEEDEEYDDLYSEIDALEDRLDEQQEVAEVQAQINALQAMHGSPFTQAEVQQIGELIDEGYTPESVYEAVSPAHPGEDQFNSQFSETLDHLQEQHGRQLAGSEVQALYDASVYEGDPRHVAPDALRDLTNRKDRIALADERLAEKDPPAETPETVEPLGEDAGPKDRAAFIDARLAGAEIEAAEADE